jgi:hypothetical protein
MSETAQALARPLRGFQVEDETNGLAAASHRYLELQQSREKATIFRERAVDHLVSSA